jgi:hypothetical protein
MPNYINKDELLRILQDGYDACAAGIADGNKYLNNWTTGYENCIIFAKHMPNADVEEVRHAKWIYKGHHEMMGRVFRCSMCERWMFTNSLNNIVGEYPYCHCGAKMEDTQGFGENYD